MKKPLDEMDRSIKLKSQSFAYRITMILLGAWALYEICLVLFTSAQQLNLMPVLVLIAAGNVQYFSELVLKRKMVLGDEEYKEPNKVVRAITTILTISIIIASVVAFIFINRN